MITRHWLLITFGGVLGAIALFFIIFGGPRAIVILGDNVPPAPTSTGTRAPSSSSVVSSNTATPSSSPNNTSLSFVSFATGTIPANWNSTPASWILMGGTGAEETARYDAKLLALANLAVITKTTKVSSTLQGATSTTVVWKTVTTTSTAKTGWPAKAAYPNAGALLPGNRIVAYYGNFYSTQMGVLGQYAPEVVLAKLASTTAAWQAADPTTHVIPAIDYIAVTAQGSAGKDGKYRLRMPDDQIEKAIQMADKMDGVVFLDIQVGLSDAQTEVPVYEKYLALPRVFLSLDPEFDMPNGERPGTVIGTMSAADINWAAQYLADLVRKNNLPPKILVVHRFTDAMVTNTTKITPLPEVQVVMDMDGFGFPAKKINTYQQVIVPYPVQFTGFKLFYKNDIQGELGHLMTPEEVLKLRPQPSYIQYQ